MAMTAGSLSSDSELDDDRFFVAAPGVKRSKSNDTDRRDEDPVASTSRLEEESDVPPARYSPHKRVRTKAPAPPQGVKRAIANRRLSDRSLQAEQARHSDGDGSFTRQPPPKKRQRSAANLKRVDREDSVPAIDEAPTPAPRRVSALKQ